MVDMSFMLLISTLVKRQLSWAENVRDELIEVLEGYYKKVSQHELRVSARFSNGETWYEKV